MSARLLLAALRFSPRQPVGLRVRFICPGSCAPPVRHFSAEAASSVPIARVKELRELTGAPLMDCKNALAASGSSVEKAVDWLRTKGIATASKKSSRAATQGVVAVAIGGVDGNVAALVELNSETDFVARNAMFQSLASRILTVVGDDGVGAAFSAATGPVGPSGLPQIDSAAALATVLAAPLPGGDALGKPTTVQAAVLEHVGKIGENIVLRRAARVHVPDSVCGAYTHNAVAPGMGSIGVVVALRVVRAAQAGGKAGAAAPAAAPPSFSLAAAPAATRTALAECARKVARHIAASKPSYLSRALVPAAALERERSVLRQQALTMGKKLEIVEKMIEGRLSKFYAEEVLLDQPFLASEDNATVTRVLADVAKQVGLPGDVKIDVAAFSHFVVGENAAAAAAADAATAPK